MKLSPADACESVFSVLPGKFKTVKAASLQKQGTFQHADGSPV